MSSSTETETGTEDSSGGGEEHRWSNERVEELSADYIPALKDGVPKTLTKSKLFAEWLNRLAEGRDMKIIIDAEGNETGVGKTLLGSQLATMMDIHGFDATEKATMDAREYMDIYHKIPRGSSAYLQESEKSGDKRRSMSTDVLELGYTFAILRKRQIFPILDLPDATVLDDRLIKSCDFRILVRDRGKATVFAIDNNDFTGEIYYNKTEYLSWDDMPEDENYQELTRMKDEWVEGELDSKYIHEDEFEKAKKNFYDKFTKKTRFHCIRGIWSELEARGLTGRGGEISQADLGGALGRDNDDLELSQQSISNILKAEGFDEYYSSLSD